MSLPDREADENIGFTGEMPSNRRIDISDLFVLKCVYEATGENILNTLKRLNKQHLITVEDAALVTLKPNGKPKIRQANDLVGARAQCEARTERTYVM